MSTDEIRIRGSNIRVYGPWPLGSFPHEIILGLSRQIVHRLAIGHSDITGDDFGTIFANAIGGTHRESPIVICVFFINWWMDKAYKLLTGDE